MRRTRILFLALVIVLASTTLWGCAQQPTAAPIPTATAEPSVPPPTVAPTLTASPSATAEPTSAATVDGVLDGRWEGAIRVAGTTIGIIVTFRTGDAGLEGVLDVPQQGASDIPLNNIVYSGSSVYFETLEGPSLATYDGELQATDVISGTFTQSGYEGTFDLQRVAVQPTPVPPYREEEVRFEHAAASLAGTLSLPEGPGPFPAVVLISGSGSQNRDEEILGFKPFALIADDLTRNGIAVLRYDDRGVGGSRGDVSQATTEDLAEDAAAAVAYLETRTEIDPQRIGLLGHSEGGLIAPMLAARSQDIAFVILLAGPGVPGSDVLYDQVAMILRAGGADDAQIQTALEKQQRTFAAVRSGEGWDELEAAWDQELRAAIAQMSAEQREQLGDIDIFVERTIAQQRASVDNPWFEYFLDYDPAPALEHVSVPVLALFGELDTQVAAERNRDAVVAALQRGGNTDVTAEILPKANHLFQSAITGSPDEYATLEKTFVPGLLDLVATWIQERAGLAAAS